MDYPVEPTGPRILPACSASQKELLAQFNSNKSVSAKELIDAFPPRSGDHDRDVEAIRNYLSRVEAALWDVSDNLEYAAHRGTFQTINKLNVALTKLYKLALFIHGDYDAREPDENAKATLFEELSWVFQEAEDRAERGLREIGDLHANVMEIQNVIPKIKDTIANMIEMIQRDLQSYNIFFHRNPQASIKPMNLKIEEAENVLVYRDIEAEHKVSNLMYTGEMLQAYLDHARELENMLDTQLSNRAKSIEDHFLGLQSRFIELKDTATKLVSHVKRVAGDGDVLLLVYTKDEIASLLLEMCYDALFDSIFVKNVQAITDELLRGYGQIPSELEEDWERVAAKLETMT